MKSLLLLATIVTLTLPTLFSQPATAQPRSTVLTSRIILAEAKLTVEQLIERAESKVTAQDYQGAIKDYTLAIQLKPDNIVKIYQLRAWAYALLNDQERALEDYNQAIKLAPNDPDAYKSRGFFHTFPDKAIADYAKAQELDPKDPEPSIRQAAILVRQGKHGEAIKAYSKYFQLAEAESTSEKDYTDRGISYQAIGDHKNALADFNQSLKLGPNYGTGYYYRGLTYRALGQKKEALSDFKKALEVDKDLQTVFDVMKEIKELQ